MAKMTKPLASDNPGGKAADSDGNGKSGFNTKVKMPDTKITADVNGPSAVNTKGFGSPSGKLAAAPTGTAMDRKGGAIPGFGAGTPDNSTLNPNVPTGPYDPNPSAPTPGPGITGFSKGALKPGKV